MEIIYLHQYFNTPSMQGGTRSYEMARRLVERGHRVCMVTSWRDVTDQTDWFVTDEDGIEVHWLPVRYGNEMSYRQRILAFIRFAWGSARRAAALDGDVVFATSTPLTIALPGVYAARRRKVPMVFEVRDLWPEMPIAIGALNNPVLIWAARLLEKFAYRNSSRIVALSPGMAEGIAATGFPESRIEVIPNSCDLELFAPQPGQAEAFRAIHPELDSGPIVLYAGTLGRVNRVDYMVQLAVVVDKLIPKARFVILGAGSEESKVRKLAGELGVLDKNLFMYRQLPKADVVKAFAAANIITSFFADIPEMEKNSANKFFDGLAAGRAIAINYGGWQADLLRKSGAGLVLSRDVNEAARQLESWLTDHQRLEQAGKAARILGEQHFSRDHLAARLEAALMSAMEAGPHETFI